MLEKLTKENFNKIHRFRESRNDLVNCINCISKTGGNNNKEGPAFCENENRFKKIKIAKYFSVYPFGPGENDNIAAKSVCDSYHSKNSSGNLEKPVLVENQAILLGSELHDIFHADPNCPYVLAELKMKKENTNQRAKVDLIDISEKVPGEIVSGDICDMPCCEEKLHYQIGRASGYRQRTGLKPDGTEPKIWVRNGLEKHGKKSNMSIEEAEAFFDLTKFNSPEYGGIHEKINTVSDHIHKCNRLGSRPLSEATNPISCGPDYDFLENSLVGPDLSADFWMYDKKLFNFEKGLEKTLKELEKIPEGIIPLTDPNKILMQAKGKCDRYWSKGYWIYGILKKLTDETLKNKGLNYFIEVGAVTFHGHEYMWGEFGKGFSELASFHEE